MRQIILIITIYAVCSCSSSSERARIMREKKQHNQSVANEVPDTETNAEAEPIVEESEIVENIESSTIKMIPVNGVYQIPVLINGVQMSFIFDTGASIISISATEALFLLKQGKLTKEDIIGTENFSDANGDISEGTIIMLKSVKIGKNELHNIKASVVLNLSAPLLMGQSALSQFGKISIDNNTKEITFE